MDRQLRARKCHCCNEFFRPDYRNGHQQVFCPKLPCRKASKAASQRRWLSQPANRDYFRGAENVRRVQQWRQAHPDYGKKKSAPPAPSQATEPQEVAPSSLLVTAPPTTGALQDNCLSDHPVFIGLLSMVTGSTLQEDIAGIARKLEARGRDILGASPRLPHIAYDYQTSDSTGADSPGAR